MDLECRRPNVMEFLRDAIISAPELEVVDKLQILQEIKATCPCFERCDRYVDDILAAAGLA